jgi:hypothetical protein
MFKKVFGLFLFLFVVVLSFNGCVDTAPTYDNLAAIRCADGIQNFDETGVDCGGNSCNKVCPPYPNELNGEVLWRQVLTPNKVYTLSGPLLVRQGATLEIHAGTIIKAVPGTNAHIAVQPGAKLWIWGTESNPVVFTSAADEPQPGDWGGIIMMGKAPTGHTEKPRSLVGNYFYGGDYEFDSSGQIRYTKIEYAGAAYQEDIYFNGLGLYGVGKNTTLSHIHISKGLGSGMAIFGGNATIYNVLSTQNQINGIEIEGGWSGIGLKWFVSQPQQHGIWIDYSSAASQNGTPFTVEDVLIKNLLQGAAFAFSQARANGLFKTVKLSGVSRGFYASSLNVLEDLGLSGFEVQDLVIQNVSDNFNWGTGQPNPPTFVTETNFTTFSDAFPDWGLPIQ